MPLLTRAVRRAEQRFTPVAHRASADGWGAAQELAAGAAPGVAPAVPGGGHVLVRATGAARAEAEAHATVGLRGLAEGAGLMRAAFFGADLQDDEIGWRDTALEELSVLLDDAALREGVDLEEGLL